MQTNTAPFLSLPPAQADKPGGAFERGDELTIERIKTDKFDVDAKRDALGFEKFNWAANFKDLNQLFGRQHEMAPRRHMDLGQPPGVRPMEEAELRHLEMEMDALRARQAKRVEADRRREHIRRSSTENCGKPVENNGKLPEYLLPMSSPGKQLGRSLGPLNVSETYGTSRILIQLGYS